MMMESSTAASQEASNWERLWAPYDELTYRAALAFVQPEDVVLEIGAGDLRLARRLAKRARRVLAIEIDQALLSPQRSLPDNLQVICADAYRYPFPEDVTLAVLLMRHCQHLALLTDKLVAAGCRRLVTNARWRVGVEQMDLQAARVPFSKARIGWYACKCGATGFLPGPAEILTLEIEKRMQEVACCPNCR